MSHPATAGRSKKVAMIHIAKSDLGLDDETYRQMLFNITGKSSCGDIKALDELEKVIQSLKSRGWKPRAKGRKYSPQSSHKKPDQKSVADKIRALWIDMYKEGLLQDGSEKALDNFCHRMVGKYSPDWLSGYESKQVIESLKRWQVRLEAERD